MMKTNNHTKTGADQKDASSSNVPAGNSANQVGAMPAAKDARIKEAGLGGNRTGEVSAEVKRAQARSDSVSESVRVAHDPAQTSNDAEQTEAHRIQVQVNTGHNIDGSEKMNLFIADTVNASLGRFGRQITRVEVHLRDDNAGKSNGDDKRCLLEARPAGHQPLVVTHIGATIDEAVEGAVDAMEKLLDHTFAKLYDPKGRTSLGEEMAH